MRTESSEFSSDETEQVIKDLAFEILYNRHPGWEISDGVADGGSGSLVIEFPSLKVSLSHSANYIASDDYEATTHHFYHHRSTAL